MKIYWVAGLILLTDALCVGVMGDGGSSITSLWKGLSVVEFSFKIFWDFMGLVKIDCRYSFWLVELVWKTLV